MVQYLVVAGITESDLVKVVLLHELVEEVGTQHNGFGYVYLHAREAVELGMALDNIVEKCQSTPFSAQRSIADTCEVGIAVELHAVEHGHHAKVFHVAIAHNGLEDNLSVCVNIL